MARSDLLLDLVEAERRGDRERFRILVEAVIAEESVVTDAGGGAVIQVELASARVSISGTASPVLVDVVLRALR